MFVTTDLKVSIDVICSQDLLTYTVEGLDLLWQEIESHSVVRQDWIIQCDNDLKRAEDDRMQMVSMNVFLGRCI